MIRNFYIFFHSCPSTVLAHLLRPQGRKGEILADLLTDFPEQFSTNKRIYLATEDFAGPESEARVAEVSDFWLPVGKNSGRIVLHLAGIDSINQAETLAGLDVLIPVSERLELEDDANYVSDLVGCALFDHANPEVTVALGTVTDVHFATTSDGTRRLDEAAPLLAVEDASSGRNSYPLRKSLPHLGGHGCKTHRHESPTGSGRDQSGWLDRLFTACKLASPVRP